MASPSVTVRVPGTTANLGPGFDTLGLAVQLYNRIRVTTASHRDLHISSPIADDAREGATAMLSEAAAAFARKARRKVGGLDVHLSGEVPIARGLGSSVTARLGLVAGLNELSGRTLDPAALLDLVSALEHHPDNAAPGLYGGFCVAGMVGDRVRCVRFRVNPRWKFVTLVPRFEVSTEAARKLLPPAYPKADTVHNLNRAALIAAAFAQGDPELLRGVFDDRVHQPFRARLIPALYKVIDRGVKAGAIGGWLSGSGSTIMCLTVDQPEAVARAMQRELRDSDVFILGADNRGCRVLADGR